MFGAFSACIGMNTAGNAIYVWCVSSNAMWFGEAAVFYALVWLLYSRAVFTFLLQRKRRPAEYVDVLYHLTN